MEEKKINPVIKQVLELGPTIAFFVAYMRMREQTYTIGGIEYDGFIIAAGAFVPILLVAMAILWKLTGKLSRIQVVTALMVIIFGGMTVWFNDETFFKMKTTIVYGLFAILLGIGLLRGQSYLSWVLGEAMPMAEEGWMKLTRRLAVGFAVLAVANEFVWRTMSTDAWVKIETFAFPLALFVFLMAQIFSLQKYMELEDEPAE
ncbi:inner membrane-spanning protein YciB [Tropicimonas sp. TH_r6]|uniref:inner membrane-spanning protein YciB n=1 Tax=Tropicimonas sp. TH_r6 TaxID=3082085 RepID=UPI002954B382|nr:inner membrane-spanning protein YciB [Tropicimonas sp. TH_r6]MDV7142492.1 inner membrane-spanning protein YciB [Tropicimonas sp. TH_r6]